MRQTAGKLESLTINMPSRDDALRNWFANFATCIAPPGNAAIGSDAPHPDAANGGRAAPGFIVWTARATRGKHIVKHPPEYAKAIQEHTKPGQRAPMADLLWPLVHKRTSERPVVDAGGENRNIGVMSAQPWIGVEDTVVIRSCGFRHTRNMATRWGWKRFNEMMQDHAKRFEARWPFTSGELIDGRQVGIRYSV